MSSCCPWRNFVMTEGPLFWGTLFWAPLFSPLHPTPSGSCSWISLQLRGVKKTIYGLFCLFTIVSIPLTYLFKMRPFFFSLVLYWVWQEVENDTHPLSDHRQSWISEPRLINKGVDQRRRPRHDEARGGKRKQEEKGTAASSARWAEGSQPFKTQESKAKTRASWNCHEWGGSASHFLLQVLETSSITLSCPRAINQNSLKVQPQYRGRVSVERVSVLLR